MKVVIIGSGNVATVLGKLLKKSKHEIIQVVSRHAEHAKTLADELDCGFADINGTIDKNADLYLLAISDGSLYSLKNWLKLDKKLVVHTAGSVPMEILQDISENYGVLYPLQSLRKELEPTNTIPLLIEGSTGETYTVIEDLAKTIIAFAYPV